jgi:putative hydrolase of the HAD superfamily
MMIRAVCYDAVGTLMHVTPSVAAVYAEVGSRFGSRRAVEEIGARFKVAFARQEQLDAEAGWRTNETREMRRWRDIVAEVLGDAVDLDSCFAELYDRFRDPGVWQIDASASSVLTAVRTRGVRQALASNFDQRLHELAQALPPLRNLDPIVVSSDIGWRKPAPAFFAHLLDLLQLPPSEVLFVGDDVVNDYIPAREAGMVSVLYDPQRKHPGLNRIERLDEIIRL